MKALSKTVFITGCASGIGECVAKKLPQHGYQVIASCRRQEDVDRLNRQGIKTILLDLADADSVHSGFSRVVEMSDGKLYGLVNNGAYGQLGAVIDLPREALRQQFETNVFGTQQLTNLLLPAMLANRSGRVIQISSVLGFVCLKYRGAYNASKFALEGLTDTMRLEHFGSGVTFSLVEPGPIETKFRQNAYKMLQQYIDRDNSMFKDIYIKVEQRLLNTKNARFTLPADAVLDAIVHALHSNKPKVRYRVTTPTTIMMVLKRILTARQMDRFLHSNSDS